MIKLIIGFLFKALWGFFLIKLAGSLSMLLPSNKKIEKLSEKQLIRAAEDTKSLIAMQQIGCVYVLQYVNYMQSIDIKIPEEHINKVKEIVNGTDYFLKRYSKEGIGR